jgi:hypothetical protein
LGRGKEGGREGGMHDGGVKRKGVLSHHRSSCSKRRNRRREEEEGKI